MAKACPDVVMDVFLTKIATGNRLVVCSGQPANFAGIAAVALADVVLTPGDGNGDYVIADDAGAGLGRKLTIAQQTDIDIDTSGNATHITLDDGATLLYVTTCTLQALVDTGTVTVPAWKIQIQDPV